MSLKASGEALTRMLLPSGENWALAAQGKNIVTSKHLFGNTYALLVATLRRFGVKVRLRDLTNIEAVREAIDDDTCCVFLEILTNPQLEVADLKAISR